MANLDLSLPDNSLIKHTNWMKRITFKMPSSTRTFKTMVKLVSVPPDEYVPPICRMNLCAMYATENGLF